MVAYLGMGGVNGAAASSAVSSSELTPSAVTSDMEPLRFMLNRAFNPVRPLSGSFFSPLSSSLSAPGATQDSPMSVERQSTHDKKEERAPDVRPLSVSFLRRSSGSSGLLGLRMS
jgi:hypothetical protein